jgi:hypothetical protein
MQLHDTLHVQGRVVTDNVAHVMHTRPWNEKDAQSSHMHDQLAGYMPLVLLPGVRAIMQRPEMMRSAVSDKKLCYLLLCSIVSMLCGPT